MLEAVPTFGHDLSSRLQSAMKALALLLTTLTIVHAQVKLPSPAWLPPSPETGAQASGSTNRPNQHWSTLVGDLLYFYDAQRSGKLVNNRVGWRNESAMKDGRDVGIDLSGGFYDAGNYLKTTFPLSWVLTSICWGALDLGGKGFDDAGQTAYLDSTLRWGLDWLIKAHQNPDTLYVQVGTVTIDNNYWGGDQNIPYPRTAYAITSAKPGTDVAASTAAAFASCSLLYSNRTLSVSSPPTPPPKLTNTTYASTLLTHSRQLLNLAVNATGGQQPYQNAVPAVADAYPSGSIGDDVVLAALFLAYADNSTVLFSQAQKWWDSYKLTATGDLSWDNKTPALPILFSQLLTLKPDLGTGSDLSRWKKEAELALDSVVAANGPGYLTPGGLIWYDGSSDFNSLVPALNAAMLLIRYAPLATSSKKTNDYMAFAKTQLDYTLGNNPMQAPYVVGINPNSPRNPHSAPASGGTDIAHINDQPLTEAYVLYGAVVGGPDKDDKYWDIRSDWVQTEAALDYNAPLLILAAWKVVTDGNDPYYVQLQAGAYDARKPQGDRPCQDPYAMCATDISLTSPEKIAIGVAMGIGGAVILILLLAYGIIYWRRKKAGVAASASVSTPTSGPRSEKAA